jgi:hypothetical protein
MRSRGLRMKGVMGTRGGSDRNNDTEQEDGVRSSLVLRM